MYGFKPGAMPKNRGGKIQGPGTGTSDSIKTDIPKGSYIMPADSTKQVGAQALGELGKPVPANVSNGEYQMPPEQVHAVGVQALNQIRDATHAPVAAGFKPQKDGLYFADGGSPAEEERKRLAGTGPSPQMGAIARGNQARVERMGGEGMYSQANSVVGGAMNYLNRGDPVKDAANAIGGFFSRSAQQARQAEYGDTGAPSASAQAPAASARTPAAQPSPAATTPSATAPASATAAQGARAGYGFTPDPMQGPALGMRVSPTSAPEIQRIDNAPGLNSPLFTNLPAGEAVSGMQGGTVNTVPAFRAPASAQAGVAAQGFGQEREGPAGGVIGSGRPERDRYTDLMREVGRLNKGGRAGRNQAAALTGAYAAAQRGEEADMRDQAGMRELGFRQEDAATRNAQSARELQERSADRTGRFALDERRLAGEELTRGFEARGLQRVEKLYSAYENAKTPEERSAIAEQLRALRGIDRENTAQVIYNEELINPAQPMAGTRRVPMLLNRDGTATAVTPRATQNAPDGMRYVGTSNGKPVYEDQNGRRFVQGGN